jgi:hypothetical protein
MYLALGEVHKRALNKKAISQLINHYSKVLGDSTNMKQLNSNSPRMALIGLLYRVLCWKST